MLVGNWPRPYAAWAMDMPAIRIESLSKTYEGGKRALDDVSFDVPRGQIFGLLGPNGAGKSTLINILAGLVTKTSGKVTIWGFDIDEHPRNSKRSIGVVPQEIIFDPFFTPRETLEIQAGLYGVPRRRAEKRRTARGDAPHRQGQCLFANALGRHEAKAARRQGDGPFAANPRARRTDCRCRCRASPPAVGLRPKASRAWRHHRAHDALSRGSRGAVRPDRNHPPRPSHRK